MVQENYRISNAGSKKNSKGLGNLVFCIVSAVMLYVKQVQHGVTLGDNIGSTKLLFRPRLTNKIIQSSYLWQLWQIVNCRFLYCNKKKKSHIKKPSEAADSVWYQKMCFY